jgi:hypothetical protein
VLIYCPAIKIANPYLDYLGRFKLVLGGIRLKITTMLMFSQKRGKKEKAGYKTLLFQ